MKAIILVGGLGTRLNAVISDRPKPMALIGDKPFLAHILDYLSQQGFEEIIFSAHYKWEIIRDYFQDNYKGMRIRFVVEEQLLGTGGAIVNALANTSTTITEPVFILNGDTFVNLNYQEMYSTFLVCSKSEKPLILSQLMLALQQVEECSRYGSVTIDNGFVTDFGEKSKEGKGLINAGVYLLQPAIFAEFDLEKTFSFETDFLVPYLKIIKPLAYKTSGYFIDIGIPADYQKAIKDLTASF